MRLKESFVLIDDLSYNPFKTESEGLWRWYHSGEPLTENSWGPGRPDPDQVRQQLLKLQLLR